MNIKPDLIIEKLKKLDPKYHYYILGGLLVLVFLLNHFILFGPLVGSLSKINGQIAELNQNLQSVKSDMARIDQNRAQFEKIRSQINEVKIKIRSKEEVPLILGDISRIASQYGVKIDQLMPMKDQKELLVKEKDVEYYALPILIQARSSYHDLGNCLAQLEADKIFYNVKGLTIMANPNDTTRHTVQMTIKAVISEQVKK